MTESSVPGVLLTGMLGIGLRVTSSASTTPMTRTNGNGPSLISTLMFPIVPANQHIRAYSAATGAAMNHSNETLTCELVKISSGRVEAGELSAVNPLHITAVSYPIAAGGGGGSAQINSYPQINAIISAPTCTVNTPDLIVNLDSANSAQLSTPGAVAGTKNFTISLVCQGGMTLLTKFTDNAASGNSSNVLTNTVAATQAGVGLQIVRNGVAVNFKTDMTITSVASDGTAVNIDLQAQYVRLKAAVTTGQVQGSFTYTLTYQ